MFIGIQPKSWDDMRHLITEMPGKWVFRGQSDGNWGLSSSLERALDQINDENRREIVERKEQILLREFMRRAHHYIPSPPSSTESLEWLALIQHYGGATRVLDFSHSFYVGAFFAVEENKPEQESAAIWAISVTGLDNAINRKIDDKYKRLIKENSNQEYINLSQRLLTGGTDNNLVFRVEPERMNERLAVQQGVFLFPCNVGESFEENLAGVFDSNADVFQNTAAFTYDPEKHAEVLKSLLPNVIVLKIVVPRYMRQEMLRDLWSMNVSSATLFPGIDGFTRSLNYHLL